MNFVVDELDQVHDCPVCQAIFKLLNVILISEEFQADYKVDRREINKRGLFCQGIATRTN